MKAVEFHPRVESLLKLRHNLRSQKWLNPVQRLGHEHARSRRDDQQHARSPLHPPVSPPE
jgi:hypothetical protein